MREGENDKAVALATRRAATANEDSLPALNCCPHSLSVASTRWVVIGNLARSSVKDKNKAYLIIVHDNGKQRNLFLMPLGNKHSYSILMAQEINIAFEIFAGKIREE